MLLGLTLPKATAHAKVLNFTSNAASLLFFILGGNVVWVVGLLMLVGQVIGARLGARMVLTKGAEADPTDDRDDVADHEREVAV